MPDQLVRRQPKPGREKDSAFTAFVKSKPCCLPLNLFPHECTRRVIREGEYTEAHHVSPRDGSRGFGLRASGDRRQVPVCWNGHRYCESHELQVFDFLNRVILNLNREYYATHPAKPKVARKPSVKIGIGVKGCPACHGEHFYPTHEFRNVTGYMCKVKNKWIDFSEVLA